MRFGDGRVDQNLQSANGRMERPFPLEGCGDSAPHCDRARHRSDDAPCGNSPIPTTSALRRSKARPSTTPPPNSTKSPAPARTSGARPISSTASGARSQATSRSRQRPGRAMWQMIGVLAELERSLISERTRAGVKAAQRRGVKFGRNVKLTPEQIEHARKLIDKGAARQYVPTF